jgi:hypothetical protein
MCSCANYPKSNKEVVGKYISCYEKKEKDYLFFKPDLTYEHVLLNEDFSVLRKETGQWHLIHGERRSLIVTNWIEFNDNPFNCKCMKESMMLTISDTYIYASADDYGRNFKKE